MTGRSHSRIRQFLGIAAVLSAVAAAAPEPWYPTDKATYQEIGRHGGVVPDCSDLHCTRILVATVLEALPGPSEVKWKAYAVAANAAGAVAAGALASTLGLPARAVALVPWIAALGFGSLFTLFDPYTSDPLMYLLGPVLLTLLLKQRLAAAGALGSIGVFAKEFAAAPLWVYCWYQALRRRWGAAGRALVVALFATVVWMTLQLGLMMAFNYSYGPNPSADLLAGGYLAWWLEKLGWWRAIVVMASGYGILVLLSAAGLPRAPRELQTLALASVPAAALFAYVQQPDRALWNFHYVMVPASALIVAQLPGVLPWMFVAAHGMANVRVGAQVAFAPRAGVALAVALLLGIWAISRARPLRFASPVVAPNTP